VPLGHKAKLSLALRQSDVKSGLTLSRPVEKILQRNGCFAGARFALQEIEPLGIEAAAKDVVEPWDSSGNPAPLLVLTRFLHRNPPV
jgi:hypothetical protein